ncbi:hypothetical protein [Herbaspirillum sp. NPDC101397]|uniref:hypothetical protein n=1 Tax=Herbaspirillum sp. NPDC101397 TaxID=3364006 RepID=UPI00383B4768
MTAPEIKGGMLAKLSALFCADENFRTFLMRRWPDADQIDTPAQATAHLKMVCEIDSRKQLDNDPAAADRFHDRIRIPYANWNMGRAD